MKNYFGTDENQFSKNVDRNKLDSTVNIQKQDQGNVWKLEIYISLFEWIVYQIAGLQLYYVREGNQFWVEFPNGHSISGPFKNWKAFWILLFQQS
jgi:hypothetical protein